MYGRERDTGEGKHGRWKKERDKGMGMYREELLKGKINGTDIVVRDKTMRVGVWRTRKGTYEKEGKENGNVERGGRITENGFVQIEGRRERKIGVRKGETKDEEEEKRENVSEVLLRKRSEAN